MTGHLEDFVWAINPLHSSKAGSGCEGNLAGRGRHFSGSGYLFLEAQKGTCRLPCYYGNIHFTLGYSSCLVAVCQNRNCRDDTKQGAAEQFQQMTKENKRFLSWSHRGMWWHGAHHTPNTSFTSLRWLEEAAPMLLPNWEICFFQDELLRVSFHSLALPFLAGHHVHSIFLHLEFRGILISWKSCCTRKCSLSNAWLQPVQSVNERSAWLSQRSTGSKLRFLFQWNKCRDHGLCKAILCLPM